MIVTDWPRSFVTVVGDIDTAGADFTVTVPVVAVAVDVGVAPAVVPVSVTVTTNAQFVVVPEGVKTKVSTFPGFVNPVHVPVKVHAYVKDPVPPVAAFAVTVMDWPRSIVIARVGVEIVTAGAASTMTSSAGDVALFESESVTT